MIAEYFTVLGGIALGVVLIALVARITRSWRARRVLRYEPPLRLRLRARRPQWSPLYTTRRGLWLTDTPRPDCLGCEGDGGWSQDYGDHTGEYAGTDDVLCPCWSGRAWLVIPIPRLPRALRRRRDGAPEGGWGGWSDEPPF